MIVYAVQTEGHELCHDVNTGLNPDSNGVPDIRRHFPQGSNDLREIVGCASLQIGIREFGHINRRKRRAEETDQGTKMTVVLSAYHGIGSKRDSKSVNICQTFARLFEGTRTLSESVMGGSIRTMN